MIMLFQWKLWHNESTDYQNSFAHHSSDISNDRHEIHTHDMRVHWVEYVCVLVQ